MDNNTLLIEGAKSALRPILKQLPKGWTEIHLLYILYGTEDGLIINITAPTDYAKPDISVQSEEIQKKLRTLQKNMTALNDFWRQLIISYRSSDGKLEVGTNNIYGETAQDVLTQL